MKPFYNSFLLSFSILLTFVGSNAIAQTTAGLNGPVITCQNPIIFQQFNDGALINDASDLYNGLPRNGSYQVVQSVKQLGGGGYLNLTPAVPGYFLAAHTSNDPNDRVWYTNLNVVQGGTYNFCASVALLKNLGSGANYILGVYANGKLIGSGRVNFEWSQICGTYTVPDGVDKVEFSLRDPKKGLFFVAIDDISICMPRPMATRSIYQPANNKEELSVFPNPAFKNFNVRFNALKSDVATIRVMDNLGKMVLSQQTRMVAGTNNIQVNELNSVAAGSYLVQVIIGGKMFNQKLLLTK